MKILTAAEMREVDRLSTERAAIASLTLMENAGKSVAEFIASRCPQFADVPILVLCGKGNNGGDGFVVARHLQKMGASVKVFLFADSADLKGDAAKNFKRLKSVEVTSVSTPDELPKLWDESSGATPIVVDALLGTGIRGPVTGLLRAAMDEINRRPPLASIFAVDIPSGLDSDNGEVHGAAVCADFTVTFTAPKTGMFQGEASDYIGTLVVGDIGSPPEIVEEVGKGSLRWSEPREFTRYAMRRRAEGHKGDYGHVLVVAGAVGKSGAAVLSSWAALRCGAGLVTAAIPAPILPIVAAHAPEIMTEPLAATAAGCISLHDLESGRFDSIRSGKKALSIGPGLGTEEETQQFIRKVAGSRKVPVILDADGLNAFDGFAKDLARDEGRLAITPHPGEMARLLDATVKDVQARRIDIATAAAAEWNCIVILKGHHTIIAAPDGGAWLNSTGNPGMATGGSGDVLTGILGSLTAQYGVEDWWRTLAFGVWLHGLAGDVAAAEYGEAPLIASDLIQALPRALHKFHSGLDRV
ncbi:MAG TPA: NAD(P)H-hydrate dehydratase [Candidatus Acidoferrum sp.]|nr:NAD(P)H-hydrate dehydratase [Candidatus Acidoferrum sp.]